MFFLDAYLITIMADTTATNPAVNANTTATSTTPVKQIFGGSHEVFENLERFEQLTNPVGDEAMELDFADLVEENPVSPVEEAIPNPFEEVVSIPESFTPSVAEESRDEPVVDLDHTEESPLPEAYSEPVTEIEPYAEVDPVVDAVSESASVPQNQEQNSDFSSFSTFESGEQELSGEADVDAEGVVDAQPSFHQEEENSIVSENIFESAMQSTPVSEVASELEPEPTPELEPEPAPELESPLPEHEAEVQIPPMDVLYETAVPEPVVEESVVAEEITQPESEPLATELEASAPDAELLAHQQLEAEPAPELSKYITGLNQLLAASKRILKLQSKLQEPAESFQIIGGKTPKSEVIYQVERLTLDDIPQLKILKTETDLKASTTQSHTLMLTTEKPDQNLQIFVDDYLLYQEEVDLLDANTQVYVNEKLNKFQFLFDAKLADLEKRRAVIEEENSKKN